MESRKKKTSVQLANLRGATRTASPRTRAARGVRIPLRETAARGRTETNRKNHRVATPDLPAPAGRKLI